MDVVDRDLWENKPTEARAGLLEEWGELVRRLARAAAKGGFSIVDADDPYQVGVVGLFKAVDAFDPEKGVPFASYASIRIMGEIRDHLREIDPVPDRSRRAIRELSRAVEAHRVEHGKPPTIAELENALGWSADKVRRTMRRSEWRSVPVQDWDGSGPTDPEVRSLRGENARRLHIAFDRLDTAKRFVIRGVVLEGRMGKDVAEDLGVSGGRVSQIKSEALGELRTLMETSEFEWEQ